MSLKKIINIFVTLYPLWIISSSLIGFFYPPAFIWFKGSFMTGALAVVMLGMGLTLRIEDFRSVLEMPGAVAVGAIIQYTVMPFSALAVGKLLNLESTLAVGLILIGSCPGGTASNVLAYLARANLALSVIMTTVSTILAIVATPLLTKVLAGTLIPVDAWGLFLTIVQVILVPVTIGVYCNYRFPKVTGKISTIGPLAAVLAIVFIAGSIVAQSAETVAEFAKSLLIGASLLHIIGFILGYIITKLLGFREKEARTVSIEAGMQNGGLAAVLAKTNFPLLPLVAVPAVFSSVIQTLFGGLLAAYWRWETDREIKLKKITKKTIKNHH